LTNTRQQQYSEQLYSILAVTGYIIMTHRVIIVIGSSSSTSQLRVSRTAGGGVATSTQSLIGH